MCRVYEFSGLKRIFSVGITQYIQYSYHLTTWGWGWGKSHALRWTQNALPFAAPFLSHQLPGSILFSFLCFLSPWSTLYRDFQLESLPAPSLAIRTRIHLDSWQCLTRGDDISFQATSNQPWVLPSLLFPTFPPRLMPECGAQTLGPGDGWAFILWYSFFSFLFTGDLKIPAISLMVPSKVWVLCSLLTFLFAA